MTDVIQSDTVHIMQNDQVAKVGLAQAAETTLESVIPVMEPIVRWLIHSGVGYTDFIAALKPIFYQQALLEAEQMSQKTTDSALSLLSGLHRKDVSHFRQQDVVDEPKIVLPISVPARVIGHWMALELPESIPFLGATDSFEALVKAISTEKHPRSIVLELERLNIVTSQDGMIVLQQKSFTPDLNMHETKALFSANLADHIAAGVDNFINHQKDFTHLEQAVFAENLTAASVTQLRQLSIELWQNMAQQMVAAATHYCEQDKNKTAADQRFRLGVYQYDASMQTLAAPYCYQHKD